MTLHAPATEAEACAAVSEARAARRPLRLQGGGTRAGLGRPTNAVDALSSAGLTGITLYEPSELVIGARAGTPVRVLEETLAAKGQMLPVEPMDHRRLYGTAGEPTVGGLVATNASGPRRFAAGAVRDHLIGVRLVNGFGEAVKSGGRVMKNVTGLDLVKLECGAHGTLGFLTEVTFKVVPRPETALTLQFEGLDDARAAVAMARAIGTPFEMTGAAHIPGEAGAPARTLLRLDGFAASVDDRAARLAALLAEFGAPERLPEPTAAALWDELRDGAALGARAEEAVWRLSVAPTRGPAVAEKLKGVARRHCFDWGGGLIWVATEAAGDAGAGAIRAVLAASGGHATLVRAPDAVRAATPVFEPLGPALAAVTANIKASFDPDRVFNPGLMYGGV
ncbi:glycolate oxidase subunit GlcE [Lichenibacterium dinghuense]|uniref:glycolate oxidase subunit GlcE n=1 Tax=Lichenibacterium dinghuense TaxID=2895977 RepID=UPI001EFFFBFE|nr:glycolate oxidase subunit GlcE [Lichenibacterium sp. 6Y81]